MAMVTIMVNPREGYGGCWALQRHFAPGMHPGVEVDEKGMEELNQLKDAGLLGFHEEMAPAAPKKVDAPAPAAPKSDKK